MLVIGHQGSTTRKPANTLASLAETKKSGADIIHMSVRKTRDNKLILSHEDHLGKSHNLPMKIRQSTLKEIQKRTAGSPNPICTLHEALHKILRDSVVFVDVKDKGSGLRILELLTKSEFKPYADNLLISSSSIRELIRIRNLNKKVKLALNVKINPFAYLAWEKKLGLTAVGFHRLYLNKLAIEAARKLDIFTYAYTVNRTAPLNNLEKLKLDAVMTDYPAKFLKKLQR